MTPAERAARAQRAKAAMDEFIAPILTETRATYGERLIEVASRELDPKVRADKITALSHALKILDALDDGIGAIVMDGDVARHDMLQVEKIERMTAPARRLLGIGPGWHRK